MDRIEVCRLDSLFPLRWASRQAELVEVGTTIEQIAPSDTADGASWACIHNGKTIRPADWSAHEVKDGSQAIFTPLPEDWATIGTWFLKALKWIAISMGTNYVASKILGVPEVQAFDSPSSSTYTFQNLQQTAAAGLPIKIAYGTHPIAGNVLEMDLLGNNPASSGNPYGSSLDLTIGLCEGEISAINSITINGNDAAGLATVTSNLGTNTQTALASDGTRTTQTVGIDLPPGEAITLPRYAISGTRLASSPAIGSEVAFGGSMTGTATLHYWSQNASSTAHARVISPVDSNIDDGSSLSGGTLSIGGTLYLSPASTNGQIYDYVDGGEVPGAPISYTTTTDVDKVRINVLFPEGLYTSGTSGVVARTVTLGYRYRNTSEVDIDENPIIVWSVTTPVVITAEQVGPFLYSIDVAMTAPGSLADRGTYLFELNHESVDDDIDGYRTRLDSVVEIQNQVYTYPNMAIVRLQIDSDSSINGSAVPNVITKVTGRKFTKWDGISLTTPFFIDASPYDNPAWIVYDLLTNNRYGIGNWVDSTNIDLQSFKDWADWCDELVDDGQGGSEKRAIWDGVFDGSVSAWEAALTVCATARATLFTVGELIKVKFERSRTPSQMFNMGNIISGSWSQSYTSRLERPTRVDVQFLNASNNYQVDVVGIDDPDAVAALLPQRVIRLELPGVTRESQALREARFRMNIEKLGEVVTFDADIDAVACEPGDLVQIQHDIPRWGEGGRATGGGSSAITLDRAVVLEAGTDYTILVRSGGDDSRETRTVSSAAGAYAAGASLSVSAPWTVQPAAGDLYTLGPYETHSKEIVISTITTTGDLSRKIEGMVYSPDIHDDGIVAAASTFVDILDPDSTPGEVLYLTAVELRTEEIQAAISWQYPDDTAISSALVWTRANSAARYSLQMTVAWPASQVTLPFAAGVSQQIAVTAVSPTGAQLQPTATTPITFVASGMRTIPDAPTGVTLTQDDDLLEISWDSPSQTVDRFEVRRGLDWVGSQAVGTTNDRKLVTGEWCPTLSSGLTEKYMVRGVTSAGNFGSVAIATEANSLAAWTGGTTQIKDFSASNWSGSTPSNMTLTAVRTYEITTPGTQAKLQTGAFDTGTLATYRIGAIVHAQFEDYTWESFPSSWQSTTAVGNTWSGYADPSQWNTAVSIQFSTRTSSIASWSAWRPLTARKVATTFKEIQVIVIFNPSNADQVITLSQLVLVVEG